MLGPKPLLAKPLLAQFDEPEPDPSMALYLQKILVAAIERIPFARFGLHKLPESESTGSASEGSDSTYERILQ